MSATTTQEAQAPAYIAETRLPTGVKLAEQTARGARAQQALSEYLDRAIATHRQQPPGNSPRSAPNPS
jgi:hypothetical protein